MAMATKLGDHKSVNINPQGMGNTNSQAFSVLQKNNIEEKEATTVGTSKELVRS